MGMQLILQLHSLMSKLLSRFKSNYSCFRAILRTCVNLYAFSLCTSKVHKYGKSTTGESWDIVADEETYYE